ncbi:MAG: AAA family ATPase [Alphaproteobacteria bacterium]
MESTKHDAYLQPSQQLSREELAIVAQDVENAAENLKKVRDAANEIIWGQEDIVDLALTCTVAGGNGFIEGVPGLAKTLFLENLAPLLSMEFSRIQFTPDLMPADILGSEILQEDEQGRKRFEFQKGPAFTQLLMADEINRAGPRTQSALLQLMQEKAVTAAGQTMLMPNPYIVMATQNPLEQDGTYPLPEAQLDRFLIKMNIDYPDSASFNRIITETTSASPQDYLKMKAAKEAGADLSVRKQSANKVNVEKVLESSDDLVMMQKLAQTLPLSKEFVKAVSNMVEYTRPTDAKASERVQQEVAYGAGPRAGQAFAQAARGRALMQGRYAPDLSDIQALAVPILGHRMKLNVNASAKGTTNEDIIQECLDRVMG